MTAAHFFTRRGILAAIAGSVLLPHVAAAETLPKIIVNRDPSCGCCKAWVAHLQAAGFPTALVETTEIKGIRGRLGVPQNLAACHTSEVAGYVVEGHVPAGAIKRLLIEKPQARGLAVPGMPLGSPGMEVEGTEPQTYNVVLFGRAGQRTFARYRGVQEL